MAVRLSIVCPALFARMGKWPILDDLRAQCVGADAEVTAFYDDGRITVGEKLNILHQAARGEYIATVADDDAVEPDYVAAILDAIGDTDIVTFGWRWGQKTLSTGHRPLTVVRAELAKRFRFPDWWQTEDRAFSTWLGQQAPTAKHIDRVLYTYNHRRSKPEFNGGEYAPLGKFATRGQIDRHLAGLA